METRINAAHSANLANTRSLRVKTKKPQLSTFISPSHPPKRKKSEAHGNKLGKASLKKKKKTLVKKISNQNDFNNFKKLFCSTFSKFESSTTINPYKVNIHQFYNQVKKKTEANNQNIQQTEEEKNCDMTNFLKGKNESMNVKTLEKTEKIFGSTMDLLDKDLAFLESFDMTKISNNVNDVKIKLDQCRKIVQKYNLNKETSSLKDENIEQLVFLKRLKTYDTVKVESKIFFEDLDYPVEFIPKESSNNSKSILGKRLRKDHEPRLIETTQSFTDAVNTKFEESMEIEDNLIGKIKDSQLDYILKFNKKEEANSFLKNLKQIAGNINLDNFDFIENDGKGLGWKIFKNLVDQNLEQGGMSTRKSLDIVGTKERFRTQKKNSDFLYYEPSHKKTISYDQEPKKIQKERNTSSHKKKVQNSVTKSTPILQPTTPHAILSAEKMSLEDRSDSESQSIKLIKEYKAQQQIELRAIKTAESLIDDYREVLHHSFRNLSTNDPNFVIHAYKQDREIEEKTGIVLQNLPQSQGLEGLLQFDLKEIQSDYLRTVQTPKQSEWGNQNKPLYPLPSPFSGNMFPGDVNNIPITPPLNNNIYGLPLLINNSPQIISQSIPIKPLENGHTILTPSNTYQSSNKVKLNGDFVIPDLKHSPPVKTHSNAGRPQSQSASDQSPHGNYQNNNMLDISLNLGRNENKGINNAVGMSHNYLNGNFVKNFGLDQILNSDDTSNVNYYTIFNAMEHPEDTINRPVPLHSDSSGTKKNIILTRTSVSGQSHN